MRALNLLNILYRSIDNQKSYKEKAKQSVFEDEQQINIYDEMTRVHFMLKLQIDQQQKIWSSYKGIVKDITEDTIETLIKSVNDMLNNSPQDSLNMFETYLKNYGNPQTVLEWYSRYMHDKTRVNKKALELTLQDIGTIET